MNDQPTIQQARSCFFPVPLHPKHNIEDLRKKCDKIEVLWPDVLRARDYDDTRRTTKRFLYLLRDNDYKPDHDCIGLVARISPYAAACLMFAATQVMAEQGASELLVAYFRVGSDVHTGENDTHWWEINSLQAEEVE